MKKINVLVTGGCGYIGNNMVNSLLKNGYSVTVIDSLINSSEKAINPNTNFYKGDIRDKEILRQIFKEQKIELVMDFAALIDVNESWQISNEYLDVNVNGLISVMEVMNEFSVKNIVFSSTAAVYGDSNETLTEQSYLCPTNPYGDSKLSAEKFMEYFAQNNNMKFITFRYFNVVGSKKIGYDWEQFSSVVPKILSSLKRGDKFVINGDNYDTSDGTCVRDYIHMEDLIQAHQLIVDNFNEVEQGPYNLSVGNGTSVFELYRAITKKFNIDSKYKIGDERPGDIVYSVASNSKIKSTVNWDIKYNTIDKIIEKIFEENKEIN